MSRPMYKDDYYKTESGCQLPIRWMSWESVLLVTLFPPFRPYWETRFSFLFRVSLPPKVTSGRLGWRYGRFWPLLVNNPTKAKVMPKCCPTCRICGEMGDQAWSSPLLVDVHGRSEISWSNVGRRPKMNGRPFKKFTFFCNERIWDTSPNDEMQFPFLLLHIRLTSSPPLLLPRKPPMRWWAFPFFKLSSFATTYLFGCDLFSIQFFVKTTRAQKRIKKDHVEVSIFLWWSLLRSTDDTKCISLFDGWTRLKWQIFSKHVQVTSGDYVLYGRANFSLKKFLQVHLIVNGFMEDPIWCTKFRLVLEGPK